ncbi:MAG TPA: tRNA pseudouridine(55) synthase TruB [Verrucomicrobiae bacterium]|nr:tRNA pseudouridine(55) synthase TruB [Verrucomicrobiae bacterium]
MTTTRSGVLLIDKPEGPSSAQVVGRVKRLLGAKKIGHLGTLDPFASGLLLLGVNEGTKVADIFLAGTKCYRGVMRLGVQTDSQDATGKVVEERPVPPIGAAQLRALEQQFTGSLQQVPPMFSALKKDGVRLYRLARQGKEVPREPRSITISALTLRRCGAHEIEFDVACSRGTYVRTLAADMGRHLGCGAHLSSLRRTACGALTIEQAVTLEELEKRCEKPSGLMLSLAAALAHLRAVRWPSRTLARLRLGQQELLGQIGDAQPGERLIRVLDQRGQLAALAEWTDQPPRGRWRLLRVFQE